MLIINLTACVETRERGFYFGKNIDKAKKFEFYNFKKQDLIDNFGYPSAELEDGSWLYYSYSTKNLKILRPKLRKEVVLLVNFDERDNVMNYHYRELNDRKFIDNVDLKENGGAGFFDSLFKGLMISPIN